MKLKVFIDIEFLKKYSETKLEKESSGIVLNNELNIVKAIFKEYHQKEVYVNTSMPSRNEFENGLFEIEMDYGTLMSLPNFGEYVKNETHCAFSLFFMLENHSWFSLAEEKGALCFSWENFENRIKNITKECHFKVDLSNGDFQDWQKLLENIRKLPTNQIILIDKYILDKRKIENNILPVIKQFQRQYRVTYLLKTQLMKIDNYKKFDIVAKEYNEVIKSKIDVDISFVSIKDGIYSGSPDFHDRILYGQYFIVDSTKGFDIKELKTNSNLQIISETIFDKYTYKRMINHKRLIIDHLIKLKTKSYYYPAIYPKDEEIEVI